VCCWMWLGGGGVVVEVEAAIGAAELGPALD
jgi:hypothetical protein